MLTWQKPGQQNVAQELIKIIINYVAELRNLLFEGKALTLLQKYQGKWSSFFSIKNNSSVNKELIRIGKLAKISKHFSFHSARHTNATLLIYKGANITTVQKLLGHKNLATTQIYGEVMGSTIIRDLKKCQKR